MKIKTLIAIAAAACGSLAAFGAPIQYSNTGTVAPTNTYTAAATGDEVGYFYGNSGSFVNLVGVWVNGTQLGSYALNNQTSTFGQSVDFGHVNAGDTIVFALDVTTKGYTVTSDPATNNDGINHVFTSAFAGETRNGVTIPTGTFVGFEDLLMPFSDLNYNDEDIVFSNLVAVDPSTTTPEPGSLLLLGVGLSGTLLAVARKQRA